MRRLIATAAVVLASMSSQAGEVGRSGAEIYHDGFAGTALLAGGAVRVPAERFPCASCHGADGRGRREGGTAAPSLSWARLRMATADRPGYDRDSFARAVTDGKDPAGRSLADVMPRYEVEAGAIETLAAYLASPALAGTPGILPDALLFAATGRREYDAGLRAGLTHAGGGAYGRRIRLVDDSAAMELERLAAAFDAAIDAAYLSAMLARLGSDGIDRVSIQGDVAPDVVALFRLANIAVVPPELADATVVLGGSRVPQAETVYARIDTLAPILASEAMQKIAVFHLGETDIRAALMAGQHLDYVEGFRFGRAIVETALAAGRHPTQTGFAERLRKTSPQVFVFDWRQGQDRR